MRRTRSRFIVCLAAALSGFTAAFTRAAHAPPQVPPPQTAPFPLSESAKRMTVPEGFNVTLFAGEPDVVQPIAFTFDDRGRLWVVESYSYPELADRRQARASDRILIFEDTDGDGKFDKRTVFCDKGIEPHRHRARLRRRLGLRDAQPALHPRRDGDDKPDGPPTVVLDGWSLKAQHNVFNGLTWGPDGWLYGCNGILSNSHGRQARHARRPKRMPHQLRRLALSPDARRRSRSSPTARPTPGASTSTTTARRSSPTA